MTLTHDHALQQGLIPLMESYMCHEHASYIRITDWYMPSEEWMLRRARQTLDGCKILVVVKDDKQAIYRHRKQVVAVEE